MLINKQAVKLENEEYSFPHQYSIAEEHYPAYCKQATKNENEYTNSQKNNKVIKNPKQISANKFQEEPDINGIQQIKCYHSQFNNLASNQYEQAFGINQPRIQEEENFQQYLHKSKKQLQYKVQETELNSQKRKKNHDNSKKNLTKNYLKLMRNLMDLNQLNRFHINFKTTGSSINQIKSMLLQNPQILEIMQQEVSKNGKHMLSVIMNLQLQPEEKSEMLINIQSFMKGIMNPQHLNFWNQQKANKYTNFQFLISEVIDEQSLREKINQEYQKKQLYFTRNKSSLKNNITHLWLSIFKMMIVKMKNLNINEACEQMAEKLQQNKKIQTINQVLNNLEICHYLKIHFIQNQQLLKYILSNKNFHCLNVKNLIDTYPIVKNAIIQNNMIKSWKLKYRQSNQLVKSRKNKS